MTEKNKSKNDLKSNITKDTAKADAERNQKRLLQKADQNKQHRYRIQFDIGYSGHPGKKMDPKSQTVPDMSLTVRQLLENHTRGNTSAIEVRKPLYFDLPIPTITDITDVDAYREQLELQLKATNDFIQEEKDIAAQKKQDEVQKTQTDLLDEIESLKKSGEKPEKL